MMPCNERGMAAQPARECSGFSRASLSSFPFLLLLSGKSKKPRTISKIPFFEGVQIRNSTRHLGFTGN